MMHTLKQMLAEADSLLERLDGEQAADQEAAQKLIDDVPQFMEAVRSQLSELFEATHRLEREFVDELNRLQTRMVERRAMMRDAGAIAHETAPQTAEERAGVVLGIGERRAA